MWGHGGLYSEWARYLEAWAADQRPLPARPAALHSDDFDPDTWVRLMLRLQQAMNDRLDRWSTTLVRHLNAAPDEFAWGRALVQAREGLREIRIFCAMAELTPEVREVLTRQIDGIIASNQQTLEQEAARQLAAGQRRSGEMQLRQLRANALTAVLTERLTPTPTPGAYDAGTGWSSGRPGSRRRILFDPRESQ